MLSWLESTPISTWIDTSAWAYPFLLTAHGLGMAVVVGVTAVTALRVLGFPAAVPLGAYRQLMPYLIVAFIVNAASGVALYISDAIALTANISFQIKIISIVIGLVLLWRMNEIAVKPAAVAEATNPDIVFTAPKSAKTIAVASLLIWWLSVIVSGRLVAYLASDI